MQAGNGSTDRKFVLTSSLNHKVVMVLSAWEIRESVLGVIPRDQFSSLEIKIYE